MAPAADEPHRLFRYAQKLLDAFHPLVCQVFGMDDNDGRLAALGNQIEPHDGFAAAGGGTQGAEIFGTHFRDGLKLERFQPTLEFIIAFGQ